MGISELLLHLADPQAIKSLSFMEKMAGGLLVTFLGMGITFLALILLQFIITLLAKVMAVPAQKSAPVQTISNTHAAASDDDKSEEELIAVISAAVAMKMQKSTSEIVLRNIRRIEEPAPMWNRAGILDQMNMRF
jgi:glutaconyl-CoA/methylmalonyl-CoA decarboxylase subunit delta